MSISPPPLPKTKAADLLVYQRAAYACCRAITQRYSTSFSLGIRCFHARLRPSIYAIYAWARMADEIVDSFHHQNKSQLLSEFRTHTKQAIDKKFSLHPVLHAFQHSVHTYGISFDLFEAFFKSMAMDLKLDVHRTHSYSRYVYGSAEVIGLMCLRVYCDHDDALYTRLKPSAHHLGAAFQKVNFLRDMRDDYHFRGRVYFPDVSFTDFTPDVKTKLENEIRAHFAAARLAIPQLPPESKKGVRVAYLYYVALFKRIQRASPKELLARRIRVSNGYKILGLLRAYFPFPLPNP